MSRRATLRKAAQWAMREDEAVLAERPPAAAADIQAMLDDPALAEALSEVASVRRLSDEEVRAMRQGRRRALGSGLAAVLVAVVGVGAWQSGAFLSPAPVVQHIETERGEQRSVQLADGSRVELDGATSLDVTIDGKSRLVELRRGEAYFDIAHEAERPFVVRAGASSTRVLGTAFSIDLSQRAVKLAVYRGKVQFGGTGSGEGGVVVPAGWRSSFAGGAAMTPTRFDTAQQDWRQAWVDTDDMVLGELIEALNRRSGPVIAPPPASLARVPLAGRVKLDDAEELLGAMGEIHRFRVVRERDRLRLVPTADGDAKMSSN
ncbi:FecR domain-containing protein [Sphingomonas sp. BT-65]|uniref:FecR family protein n=1 Tax=Sphingomonas sp. BT-65 TaxID=2989821 RepID=UPI0022365D5D|nr:FecR domain-containing protein [Sphingomonas sp. BT-65]MCW4460941.1 FecR domain-containing protein [Sphingomonas sp. BT-65]